MEAVIFDMDGVLIDSEPLWRKAMILEINKFFKQIGIDYNYQEKDCLNTKGMRIDKVIEGLFIEYKIVGQDSAQPKLVQAIITGLKSLIKKEGKPMTGSLALLNLCKMKKYKLALASSSSRDIIETVLEVLKIKNYFKVILSGDDVVQAKPDPEIFNMAQEQLLVEKNACLIIEDSINGLKAAVRSGMRCIAVPEPHDLEEVLNNSEFDRVMVLESLVEVDNDFFEALCF